MCVASLKVDVDQLMRAWLTWRARTDATLDNNHIYFYKQINRPINAFFAD